MTRAVRWGLGLFGLWLLAQVLRIAWFWYGPVEPTAPGAKAQAASVASAPVLAMSSNAGAASAQAMALATPSAPVAEALARDEARYCKRVKGLERELANWAPESLRGNAHAMARLSRELTGLNGDLESLHERQVALLQPRLIQVGGQRGEALGLTLLLMSQEGNQGRKVAWAQLKALAETSSDPLVVWLAIPLCKSGDCLSKLTERWTALEPENAAAWLRSQAPPELVLQRVSQASRWDDHWPTLMRLLNQAAPPDAQSPADAMLTVSLIGLEAAMTLSVLPRSVCSRKSTPEQAARCLVAAERLWQLGAPPSIDRFVDAKSAVVWSGASPLWAQRLAEQQALMNVEQRLFSGEIYGSHYLLGCEPARDNSALFAQQIRRSPRHQILREALQRSGHSIADWAAATASSPLTATLR